MLEAHPSSLDMGRHDPVPEAYPSTSDTNQVQCNHHGRVGLLGFHTLLLLVGFEPVPTRSRCTSQLLNTAVCVAYVCGEDSGCREGAASDMKRGSGSLLSSWDACDFGSEGGEMNVSEQEGVWQQNCGILTSLFSNWSA